MKKILIILIIVASYLCITKDNLVEQAKKKIGIESINGVQVLEKGSTQETGTDYIIFKVKNKNNLRTIVKDYQEISSFNSQGNNPNLLKIFKYFDKDKKYYLRDIDIKEKNIEIFIQEDIIIYIIDYSGLL